MNISPITVHAVGWLTVVSALAGTALALTVILWPEQVPDTRWSFPFDASSYVAFQISFFLHDLTLIPGLALVAAWAWPSASRATRIGLGLTVASMVAGAVIELAAVSAAWSSRTSTAATVLGTAYGVMSLGFGIGFIMAGLAFRRHPLIPGRIGQWTYLLIGAWTFFPMLPSLFMPMVWGRITIGIWFLMFAGIGVTILQVRRSGLGDMRRPPAERRDDGVVPIRMSRYLIMGGICGLAWAAALRGWMAQLANGMSDPQSQVTWLTLVLILLPGVAVGAALGYSAYLRTAGRRGPRWLIFTPILFASALLDPKIFNGLITDGIGGGSLVVIATALSVGNVLTRRRWSIKRALVVTLGAFGLLIMFGMGAMAAPLGTPRGMWVGLFGLALVLLLGTASVLPYRPVRTSLGVHWWIALGALIGFAWAAGLRGFMTQVVIEDGSSITWSGTFLWILTPGLVAGGLLGWAAYLWRHGGPRRARWLALSPFIFATMLVPPLVTLDFESFFTDGIGGGTIGVPAAALAGAYALAGRRTWLRALTSLLPLASIPIWVLTASKIGGAQLGLDTTRGLWVALYYWSLLAVIALACAIPLRITPEGVYMKPASKNRMFSA